MSCLPRFTDPNLLVNSDDYDDAGVYKLSDEIAIIQTLDFFTPIVDDPFLFGQIAAANSLSDVYAMGGKPLTAMNITAFPACGDRQMLSQILLGGADKIKEAGALLIGGHTIDDHEPKYGLSVCGIAHPDSIVTNRAGCAGDLLFLTKPVGTGIISAAIKADFLDTAAAQPVWQSMIQLNDKAAAAMCACGVRCATDVTGFGLLGHCYELTAASGLGAEIWFDAIPVFDHVKELAKEDVIPGGAYRNLNYLQEHIQYDSSLAEYLRLVLCDPQTSGGLLIAIAKEKAAQLESLLEASAVNYGIIGILTEKRGIKVIDRK